MTSDEKVTNKWMMTGLLNGLSPSDATKIARGLENEAAWLLGEHHPEYNDLLIPIAHSLMVKLLSCLEMAVLPAFLAKDGKAYIAESKRCRTRITENDLRNVTPELVERLAQELYEDIMRDKANKETLYLYTPVMMYPLTREPAVDLEFGVMFRAVWV